MRRVFLLILLAVSLICLSQSDAGVVMKAGTAGGPSYLLQETCESSQPEKNWTTSEGTPAYNQDTTGLAMEGSYCINLTDGATDESAYTEDFTAAAGASNWYSGMFRWTDATPAATAGFFMVQSTVGGDCVRLDLRTDGRIKMIPGGVTEPYFVDSDTGDAFYASDNTTYYIKVRFKKGSGADAEAQGWVDDDGTWGANSVSVADGGSAADGGRLRIENPEAGGGTLHADDIRIDDENIGNY